MPNSKIASSSLQIQNIKLKKYISQILIPKRYLKWITLNLNYFKHMMMNYLPKGLAHMANLNFENGDYPD